MDARFAARGSTGQKIKVAAFVGLGDVPGVHPFVPPLGERFRRVHLGSAIGNFLLGDMPMDRSLGHIDLDLVAISHQCQRSACRTLGSNVQDAGAVTGATHPGITQPNHVADSRLQQLLGDRQHAPFREPRRAQRAGAAKNQHAVGGDVQVRDR